MPEMSLLKRLLDDTRMTQAQFARIADVDPDTVSRWCRSDQPPRLAVRYLELLVRIRELAKPCS